MPVYKVVWTERFVAYVKADTEEQARLAFDGDTPEADIDVSDSYVEEEPVFTVVGG